MKVLNVNLWDSKEYECEMRAACCLKRTISVSLKG